MSQAPEPTARRKVLIADDDDGIRETLVEVLEDEGWTPVSARNGQEALAKAIEEPFDLLILDHRMPGLLGGEVHATLRERGMRVPVILMTAANRVQELAQSFGIPLFLGKPFRMDDLLRMLERVTTLEE